MKKMREMVEEGFSVVFRPHPVERPLLERRYGRFFEDMKIAVDLSNDFYEQLRSYGVVVGDGRSTSLFEAFAIAKGRVFVLEMNEQLTKALPNHRFLQTIKSAKDLKNRLAEKPEHEVSVEQLFAPNWRERFSKFVSSIMAH